MNRRDFLKQLLSVAAAPYIFDVGANLWRKQPGIVEGIPWGREGELITLIESRLRHAEESYVRNLNALLYGSGKSLEPLY